MRKRTRVNRIALLACSSSAVPPPVSSLKSRGKCEAKEYKECYLTVSFNHLQSNGEISFLSLWQSRLLTVGPPLHVCPRLGSRLHSFKEHPDNMQGLRCQKLLETLRHTIYLHPHVFPLHCATTDNRHANCSAATVPSRIITTCQKELIFPFLIKMCKNYHVIIHWHSLEADTKFNFEFFPHIKLNP